MRRLLRLGRLLRRSRLSLRGCALLSWRLLRSRCLRENRCARQCGSNQQQHESTKASGNPVPSRGDVFFLTRLNRRGGPLRCDDRACLLTRKNKKTSKRIQSGGMRHYTKQLPQTAMYLRAESGHLAIERSGRWKSLVVPRHRAHIGNYFALDECVSISVGC